MAVNLFQIYYDSASYEALDKGFTPLDNSRSERPDWYEFWPIRTYLKNTELEEDAWYGFFSPKFERKTGFKSDDVRSAIEQTEGDFQAALFSSTWDFIAYFRNAFEQGELWHEHITAVSQEFFRQIDYDVNLENLVNHSHNSVTSNYIVAKPAYWRRWLYFADKLLDISESGSDYGTLLNANTTYGPKLVPWKVFIQERLHSVILANESFPVIVPDQSLSGPIFEHLFNPDIRTRKMLQTCDTLKQLYTSTGDKEFLNVYEKTRSAIHVKPVKFR